ncbi:hypothetical protein WN944_009306 [Citrus x changshan-huyou]|uniref:Uncharacterized protein n=1 Tax=Citrus x changshan-huyou TaxID=2935761 RepID=A0AAP0MVY8_9ROSI
MAPTTKIVLISVISFWLISSFQLAGCSRPGFGVGGDTSISTQAQVMQRNGTVCFYCFCLYRIANEQRIPNESAAARVSNMRSFHCFVFVGNKSERPGELFAVLAELETLNVFAFQWSDFEKGSNSGGAAVVGARPVGSGPNPIQHNFAIRTASHPPAPESEP